MSAYAPGSQMTPYQAMMVDVNTLRGLKGRNLEQTYLEWAMDHLRSEMNLARLATQHSSDPKVRQQAWKIMSQDADQITRMRRQLRRRYGYYRTPKPQPRMAEVMDRLTGYNGERFDREFANAMTLHQQGAILASQVASQRVPNRNTRRLASDVVQGTRRAQRTLQVPAA